MARWYAEERSGRSIARPELERLRQDARQGLFRKLYVFRLDRLTRSGIRDTFEVVEALSSYGVELVSVADGFDLTGPAAEVVLAVMPWASKMERLAINERISAARERIEAEGGRWGRPRRLKEADRAKVLALKSEGAAFGRLPWRSRCRGRPWRAHWRAGRPELQMNRERFVNLLAAAFGALGSIYTLTGLPSPDLMADLSVAKADFNPELIASLAGQKADSIVGMVFIGFAFFLAALNLAAVPDGKVIFKRRYAAIVPAVAIAGASFFAGRLLGNAIQRHEKRAIGRVLSTRFFETTILKRKQLSTFDVVALRDYARELLEIPVNDAEPPRILLKKFADAVGKQVPADFDFSDVEKQ